MRTSPAECVATSRASAGSRNAETSLTTRAPASSATRAGSVRQVSAEIGTGSLAASRSTARARRAASSDAEIPVGRYGAVDRAPTSMSVAPASTMARAVGSTSASVRTEPA